MPTLTQHTVPQITYEAHPDYFYPHIFTVRDAGSEDEPTRAEIYNWCVENFGREQPLTANGDWCLIRVARQFYLRHDRDAALFKLWWVR